MRTTLDLDEDILFATKELAKRTNRTMGQTLSDLARASLISGSSSVLHARDVSAESVENPTHPQDGKKQRAEQKQREERKHRAEQRRLAWMERFGIVPFPRTEGSLVTNELVNRIRDEEGI